MGRDPLHGECMGSYDRRTCEMTACRISFGRGQLGPLSSAMLAALVFSTIRPIHKASVAGGVVMKKVRSQVD